MTNHVNCAELPAVWITPIGILNSVKALRTWKKAFHVHISMNVIPTQKLIRCLWWLHISKLRDVWLFCQFYSKKKKTQNFYIYIEDSHIYPADSVTATQRDSYEVWQLHCDYYTLWQLHIVTATQCESYNFWQLSNVTATQCDSYTVWLLHSKRATRCDSKRVWQLHRVRFTNFDSYTVWQLHCVTAAQCDC